MPEAEMTEEQIDRHNARGLWDDAINHLTVAAESLDKAGGAIEDLATYGFDGTKLLPTLAWIAGCIDGLKIVAEGAARGDLEGRRMTATDVMGEA